MEIIKSIQNRIYEIRGDRVMLDFDLSALYEVPTKALNQAVKRNIKRFPEDFMFRLTGEEWNKMRSQSVTAAENTKVMGSQSVTALQSKRNNAQTPYAFTEQGVAMLRGVLISDKAIDMNVAIMRAFIAIKKIVINQNNFKLQMEEIKEKLGEHDTRLNQIYETMENLLDEKVSQRKWEQRQRIGFNK